MLVRDEARTLGRAIDSAQELADEVVVAVDNETRDDSADVAAAAGARVLPIDFMGMHSGSFSSAHNWLHDQARFSWAVKLDGHEFFLPGHSAVLRQLIDAGAGGYNGIATRMEMSEEEGGHLALVLRCYRILAGARYEGHVHENVRGLGEAILGRPDVVIRHERSRLRHDRRRLQRLTHDHQRLVAAVDEQPDNARLLFHLAESMRERGEVDQAKVLACRALAAFDSREDVRACEALLFLAWLALERDALDDALDHARGCLERSWNLPEAWCVEAEVWRRRGAYRRAAFLCRAALAIGETPPRLMIQRRYGTWWPLRALGRDALRRGDADAARTYFRMAARNELPLSVKRELEPWLAQEGSR